MMAEDLKALNESRKEMTEKGVERAVEMIETSVLKKTVFWLSICRTVMKVLPVSLQED